MARDRANIRTDMLGDTDYRSLSVYAQHLYMHLLIHPTLNYAGVADWRPGRLAKMTAGMTAKQVMEAAEELQRGSYIYCDDESEEVFIRSFVRHDGLLKRVRMGIAMAKAYAEVSSPEIRRYFTHELKRLHEEDPALECWEDARVKNILTEPSEDMKSIGCAITQPLPEAPADPSSDPFGTPSFDPFADPSGESNRTASGDPSPTTSTTTATATPPEGGGSGGRRSPERPLPDDWAPNSAHAEAAAKKGLDLEAEAETFKNHALANDRRLRNWDAGFRMWLSKSKNFNADRSSDPWAALRASSTQN